MHEYAIKLELKEGADQTQQEDLESSEDTYNRLMAGLTELKAIKIQKADEVLLRKTDNTFQSGRVNGDIEKLRRDKESMVSKQQQIHKENEDRSRKIEHLATEITKQ